MVPALPPFIFPSGKHLLYVLGVGETRQKPCCFQEVSGLLGGSHAHLAALPGHRLPSGVSGSAGLRWGSLRICIPTWLPS